MNDFRVGTEWLEDVCVLHLDGEARLETVEPFDQALREIEERGVTRVAIDMSGLAFMDSASAGMLLRLNSRLAEYKGRLVLYDLRKLVSRLLERTGLSEQFPVVGSREEALALLAD